MQDRVRDIQLEKRVEVATDQQAKHLLRGQRKHDRADIAVRMFPAQNSAEPDAKAIRLGFDRLIADDAVEQLRSNAHLPEQSDFEPARHAIRVCSGIQSLKRRAHQTVDRPVLVSVGQEAVDELGAM